MAPQRHLCSSSHGRSQGSGPNIKSACLNHAGVTTMKRHDQGYLHPLLLLEHPKTNMSRPGIEPGSPASQASTLAKSCLNSF
jgi:hypothetical protein